MTVDELDPQTLQTALQTLGELLQANSTRYEFVVIGGASLSLRRYITRSTRDVDVLGTLTSGSVEITSPLPEAVLREAQRVAAALGLQPNWFGDDRTHGLLARDNPLPPGFASRLEEMSFGQQLHLHLASRQDIIALKMDAALTLGDLTHSTKHHDDLRALAPQPDEVEFAANWLRLHFPPDDHQADVLTDLVSWLEEHTS